MTFAPGETEKTITVLVHGDTKVEDDETFFVNLANARLAGEEDDRLSIAVAQATGTIENDDAAVISTSDPSVLEGGVLAFEVTISNPVDVAVRADWATADGMATVDDDDYTALSVEDGLLFAAGSTAVFTINVQTTDDDKAELDETLSLILSNLSAGGRAVAFAGGESTLVGTGTILNDDPVTIVGAPTTVLERTPVELTTSAADAGDDTFSYAWSVAKDGTPYATGSAATFGFTPEYGAAVYVVTLAVTANGAEVGHAEAQINVTSRRFPWQNPLHPCDVTGNGEITAQDVLVLINEINRGGARDLPVPPQPPDEPPPFFDVSGDNRLAPVDVLIVINYINLHGAGPIPSESPPAIPAAIPADWTDDARAEGEREPLRPVGLGANAGGGILSNRGASPGTDHARVAADSVFAQLGRERTARTLRGISQWTPLEDLLSVLADHAPDWP